MALDIRKFIDRFVEEAREIVDRLGKGVVTAENDPHDGENVAALFRDAHTLKGSSRMVKLMDIAEAAHSLEDVLSGLRDGKITMSPSLSDVLLRGIDAISAMVEKAGAGEDITGDGGAVCRELSAAVEKMPLGLKDEAATDQAGKGQEQAKPKAPKNRLPEAIRINAGKLDDLIRLMGEIVSNQNRSKQRLQDIKEVERLAKGHLELAMRLRGAAKEPAEKWTVSAQNLFTKLKHLAAEVKNDVVIQELLGNELRNKALVMRMIPLSRIFEGLPRMVRDVASSLGKEVEIQIEGGHIELDRKVMEKISDPLVHMVRNAVDHGLEAAQKRIKAGKPARGRISLHASYDAGHAVIELADDGAGISMEKLRQRALQRRLYRAEEIDAVPEKEMMELIFQPGFSTSSIITDISGRGVGMEVVKKNIIEDLRGTINIETKTGAGTTFSIRLPLTLAVMRILLVKAATITFAVASHYVREVVRVRPGDIMDVVDKKAIKLRSEFIPVARLDRILKLPNAVNRTPDQDYVPVVIVQFGRENLGIIVDRLIDEEDMVIKALPSHMHGIDYIAGVTVSGSNELITVLHIPALMDAVKQVKEVREPGPKDEDRRSIHILIVDDSVNTREIEKSILESYGYKVTLAEDGMEGLAKARERLYDLVITDVEMPFLDGFSLTEQLRKDEAYKNTPIIIVTSREKEEDKRRGIQVGADAYIVKGSFDQNNLLETVQNLAG